VEEIWYFVQGQGEMWLKTGEPEEDRWPRSAYPVEGAWR